MYTKEKIWIEALVVIAKILKENEIPYFLDAGTLLGAIRDKSFIPWDNDIDIGVNPENEPTLEDIKELSNKICANGFNVTSTLTKICVRKENTDVEINIQFYKNDEINYYFVEEFVAVTEAKLLSKVYTHVMGKIIFKKGQSLRFNGMSLLSHIMKILASLVPSNVIVYLFRNISLDTYSVNVPKVLLNEITEYPFYQYSFIVPKDYSNYLEYKYGDWRTHVKDYNFMLDDKAAMK